MDVRTGHQLLKAEDVIHLRARSRGLISMFPPLGFVFMVVGGHTTSCYLKLHYACFDSGNACEQITNSNTHV